MADVTVTVPTTTREKEDWIREVSNLIAAGDDVVFKDDTASATNVNVHYLLLNTSKYVSFRAVNQTDAQRVRIKFASGEWHRQNVHKIFGAETELSAEIHAKTE